MRFEVDSPSRPVTISQSVVTRRCLVDSHKSPEIVTLIDVGECEGTITQRDFEFSREGSFTRLHMRCLRCKSTWVEHREFECADLETIVA